MNIQDNIILIAVRLKSKRLKRKALLPLGDTPLIVQLVNRLKYCKLVNKIVICTSTNPEDDELEKISTTNSISFYRGSELNLLNRFLEASKKFNAKNIVRVTGDNPLTDPEIIDKMLKAHISKNYDYTYCDSVPVGVRSEVINREVLNFCNKNVNNPNNSEYMTWMLNRPDIFKVHNLNLKKHKLINNNLNFTIDNKKEYLNVKFLFDKFGNKYFTINQVLDFLSQNPQILKKYILKDSVTNLNIDAKFKFDK